MKGLFILIFSLFASCVSAQVTIQGIVKNENGEPISNVSIIVRDTGENATSNFTFTDKLGQYKIDKISKSNTVFIETSHIGYVNLQVAVDELKYTQSTIIQNIVLHSRSTLLDSIVITSIPPISIRGDTTEYNALKFGSDKVDKVEDLLRRLPGVQVDEEGNIKFKNKAIASIFINGVDLFSSDYKKLTKNLSAAYLSTVEVIENHYDNPVLADFDFSKQSIINLKLKKSVLKLFGEISAGHDVTKAKREANANLFSLFNKVKIALIGNHNNIGQSIYQSNRFQSFEELLNNTTSPFPYNNPSHFVRIPTGIGLKKDRYNLNNDDSYSLNMNGKLLKKIDVKIDGGMNFANQIQSTNNFKKYLFSQPLLTIKEVASFNSHENNSYGNLKLSYVNSNKLKIDVVSKYYSNKSEQISQLNIADSFNNSQNSNLDNHYLNSRLTITKKLKKKAVGQLDISFQKNKSPQVFYLDPMRFGDFLGLNGYDSLVYNYNQELQYISVKPKLFLKWMTPKVENELVLLLEYARNKQDFSTIYHGLAGGVAQLADKRFNNKETIITNDLSFETNYKLVKNRNVFSFRAKPTYRTILKGVDNKAFNTITGPVFLLPFSVSYQNRLSNSKSLKIEFNRHAELPNSSDLFAGFKLVDYRSFNKFDLDTSLLKLFANRIQIQYSNTNVMRGKTFIGNISFSSGKNNFLLNYDYAAFYSQQTSFLRTNSNTSATSFIIYEKTIPKITSLLSTKTFISYFNRPIITGTQKFNTSSLTFDSEIKLRTAFKKSFNFSTGLSTLLTNQYSRAATSSVFQYKTTASGECYLLRKSLILGTTFDFVHYAKSQPGVSFLDLDVKYKFKKKHFETYCKVRNIFNNKKYNTIYNGVELSLENNILLQPRIFLMGITFRF